MEGGWGRHGGEAGVRGMGGVEGWGSGGMEVFCE